MAKEKTQPWKLKDVARGGWQGLTLGTNNPLVAAATGLATLGTLGYLTGPNLIRRINPKVEGTTGDLRRRGLALGLLGGTALAGTPALLNWWGKMSRGEKKAGTSFGRHYVPYRTAMRNIAEQDTLNPIVQYDFAKAVDEASDSGNSGLVPISSVAQGLMGFGLGRVGSALGGALIGASKDTQQTLNRVGGWAGAAAAVPGLIDWSR